MAALPTELPARAALLGVQRGGERGSERRRGEERRREEATLLTALAVSLAATILIPRVLFSLEMVTLTTLKPGWSP